MADRKIIMVVDDELIMRECLADILSDDGYDVIKKVNGEDALAYEKLSQVDLVISDLKMPGMSGHELFQKLKEEYPLIAVVLMTAYSMDMKGRDFLKEGAKGFILKPFEISQIRETVHTVFINELK